jgi:small nuclear ribonucleoprotein
MERNPLKVLTNATNSQILCRLKDGTEYKGRLQKVDAYMNMVLSDAAEMQDGEPLAKYGEIFIRGNNVLFIKPDVE